MEHIRQYITELKDTLDRLPMEPILQTIMILHEARMLNRQVFILGNGGSASTASHFVCDLSKNTRHSGWPHFRVIGLADNMATFSAFANDEGYASVFAQQLATYVQPDDIAIGISTSGNSPNVVEAIKVANEIGGTTIGFTGFDGGQLSQLAKIEIHVPSSNIEQVEDVHLALEHLICTALRQRVQAAETPPSFAQVGRNWTAGANGQYITGIPDTEIRKSS